MTRTARYKLTYFAQLVVLGVMTAVVLSMVPQERRGAVMILLALVLFVPGRIQGAILREHFRGRRLADVGRFDESIRESEAFMERVAREPWRKRAVWLGGVVYSRDIEAMTLNNIGYAALHLGEREKARRSLERALELDPAYPVPHLNLAVLASMDGDADESRRHLEEASRFGYRGTSVDTIARQAQEILAMIEGRR
jgi:tetratricopeptide (TPR) repeat protein